MCQRVYRPGYSMPELSTPPRRRSTSAATRVSSAGSNERAVRVTVTPPLTVTDSAAGWPAVLSVVSTVGPLGSGLLAIQVWPGKRREKQKRPPYPGRPLRKQKIAPPTGGATTEGLEAFSSREKIVLLPAVSPGAGAGVCGRWPGRPRAPPPVT